MTADDGQRRGGTAAGGDHGSASVINAHQNDPAVIKI